jgi:hypothetical protein
MMVLRGGLSLLSPMILRLVSLGKGTWTSGKIYITLLLTNTACHVRKN